jgi:hypothetical protein
MPCFDLVGPVPRWVPLPSAQVKPQPDSATAVPSARSLQPAKVQHRVSTWPMASCRENGCTSRKRKTSGADLSKPLTPIAVLRPIDLNFPIN